VARVIRFRTSALDVTKEQPNPINPIRDESLLLWLTNTSRGSVELSAPGTEDWGWYSYADWKGRRYLLGASACDEEQDGQREWVLQIDKQRSVKEKLLDQARMGCDDECAEYFLCLLKREANFQNVSVDPGP
jgi:hypothetical protein